MDRLKLSDNIIRLRHECKMTQEELADFLGVTKASVSKWENGQSTPDLMILLQLAAFFDITIDELLGYEAQLSKEQIRRFYGELVSDFAKRPFHEVIEKTRALARRYYSCHPFLLQLCVLYLNHFMLAASKEKQEQILEEAVTWCVHILENCSDVGVCNDALALKAGLSLRLGRAEETINLLEPALNPIRLAGQDGALLVQAYQAAGEYEKAKAYVQIREYLDVLNLVGDALMSLDLYKDDLKRCRETVCRIRTVMEQYELEKLHPNNAAQFHYQTAAVYAMNGKKEEVLHALCLFEKCVNELLRAEKITLHGDEYFDRLDAWIEGLPLGDMALRSRKFIVSNVRDSLCRPIFDAVKEDSEFKRIVRHFENDFMNNGTEGGEDYA